MTTLPHQGLVTATPMTIVDLMTGSKTNN